MFLFFMVSAAHFVKPTKTIISYYKKILQKMSLTAHLKKQWLVIGIVIMPILHSENR
jgi:hypothetical protein